MIRIILYRLNDQTEWAEGIIHSFVNNGAVIENKMTSELSLVPITPATLKFKVTTEQWVQIQMEAQQRAQARAVMATPPPSLNPNWR